MKLGRFTQKIKFISEGQISDGAGGYENERIIELETFANIEQLRKGRDLEQAQLMLKGIYRVQIHYRKSFDVSEKLLVEWKNEIYNIISSPEINDVRINKVITFDIAKK